MKNNLALPQAVRRQIPLLVVLSLSSALSILLVSARVLYADSITYTFLVWNLFLAWIPLGCAFVLWWMNQMPRRPVLLMTAILATWFLFFPNAPYIMTDLIHITPRYPVPLWYDAILIFSFSWNGLLLGLLSLLIVQRMVEGWFGKGIGWLMAAVTVIASGFGVYLGRFERWNSWDVIAEPQLLAMDVFDRLINPMAYPRTLAVTLIFAAFMAIAYLTLHVLVSSNWRETAIANDHHHAPTFGSD